MSFTKKLVVWIAFIVLAGFFIGVPGWVIVLTLIGGYGTLLFQEHHKFRRDFILFFESWHLSEREAAAIVTKFAHRVGQTCIQQERVQWELALIEREELVLGPAWRQRSRQHALKRQIKHFQDSIDEFKEEWIAAKRLFMRRFPEAGEPLHWSDIEPYYTQGRSRASFSH
jgi:hypothetical protein